MSNVTTVNRTEYRGYRIETRVNETWVPFRDKNVRVSVTDNMINRVSITYESFKTRCKEDELDDELERLCEDAREFVDERVKKNKLLHSKQSSALDRVFENGD